MLGNRDKMVAWGEVRNFFENYALTLAISVNNALIYTKEVLERYGKGISFCDYLFPFNELLLTRKQRENFCGLQLLNIVSKRNSE